LLPDTRETPTQETALKKKDGKERKTATTASASERASEGEKARERERERDFDEDEGKKEGARRRSGLTGRQLLSLA